MPEEMAANCRILLERRIEKTVNGLPEPGAEVTILYSDKDPLMQSEEVDDQSGLFYLFCS